MFYCVNGIARRLQAFFNYLIPDHDAKVFNPPSIHPVGAVDHWINLLLEGFRRWDGVYFLHVAEHGYTYENTLAFFPMLPVLAYVAANTVLLPLHLIANRMTVLLVAATIINLLLFVASADVLYRLGRRVLGDEMLAYKAAQLYCINPASIFFSAAYSETCFAFFSFSGMLCLEEGQTTGATVFFGLGSFTRSNGLVNCGFVAYRAVKGWTADVCDVWSRRAMDSKMRFTAIISTTACTTGVTFARLFVCILPFLAFQYYAACVFCNPDASYRDLPLHVRNYGNALGYKMPYTGVARWCSATLPLSYAHVQASHWEVGLFGYYELKQLPNFLLAAPMVALCAYAVVHFIHQNPIFCASLGMYDGGDAATVDRKKVDDHVEVLGSTVVRSGLYHRLCFVYIVHMTCLTLFGVLFMHVQVRYVSS